MRYEFGTKVSVAAAIGEGGAAGQLLRRPHPRRGARADRGPDRPPLRTRRRRPRLPRARRQDHARAGERPRKGITPALARLLRRRSTIEPEIGHMKTESRLTRCPLKGIIGGCTLRRPLCLRPQSPQDPRPPEDAFGVHDRRNTWCDQTREPSRNVPPSDPIVQAELLNNRTAWRACIGPGDLPQLARANCCEGEAPRR